MPGSDQDPTSWTRLRTILEQVLELPESDRPPRLEHELADDPALLDRARSLLAQDDDDDYLVPPQADTWGSSRRIGPYVTRRVLGNGGMGTVYLATRADGEFHRTVALKLVRPGMDTEEVLARFRRERQVQANLAHPGIAQLLDGGATEDGTPYLVMEYVEGTPIDRYCDENKLTTDERLRLFHMVCEAVQNAHESLVVHRDLKPSNIIVTAQGQPKLLDFGIAKVLDPEKISSGAPVTRDVIGFMTPAYASPEQLRGSPVSTASDLYSLGVILYELLTGHPPHPLEGRSPAEIERIVSDVEPESPSRAVQRTREVPTYEQRDGTTRLTPKIVSERRGSTPNALRRGLQGDLDRIVMMCVRKEPMRRYASVRALSEDIDRFLAGRPIFARPDSLVYRASKFVHRNRLPVTIAAIAFLTLGASLVFSLSQYRSANAANELYEGEQRLAQRRLENMRRFRRELLNELRSVVLSVPGATQASERLVQLCLRHLDEEVAGAEDDPELLTELGETYVVLGELRGSNDAANLGRGREAIDCFRRALSAARKLHDENPGEPHAVVLLANVMDRMGDLIFQYGDYEEGFGLLERALGIAEACEPTTSEGRAGIDSVCADLHDGLARAYLQLGRYDEGLAHVEELLEIWGGFVELRPDLRPIIRGQTGLSKLLESECLQLLGRTDDALAAAEEARELFDEVLSKHPASADREVYKITISRRRAWALRTKGDMEEALAEHEQCLVTARDLARAAPGDFRAKSLLESSERETCDTLMKIGRVEEALAHGEASLELARELAVNEPEELFTLKRLVSAELTVGQVRLKLGDPLLAAELLGSARRRAEDLIQRHPLAYEPRAMQAWILIALAELQCAQADQAASNAIVRNNLERACERLDEARRIADELVAAKLGGPEPVRIAAAASDGSRAYRQRLAVLD